MEKRYVQIEQYVVLEVKPLLLEGTHFVIILSMWLVVKMTVIHDGVQVNVQEYWNHVTIILWNN